MIKKFLTLLAAYKITTVVVSMAVVLGGYWIFSGDSSGGSRYVLAAVKTGRVTATISGSGQVSASNSLDIKPKISGDIIYVTVASGDEIFSGQTIFYLDAANAEKAVRDAEINLENAKIAMEKLVGSNGAANARNKEKAANDLAKAYDDGFNSVSDAFLDLPPVMSGLKDIMFGNDFSGNQANIDFYADAVKNYDALAVAYRDDAYQSYREARTAYDKNFTDYKSASRFSEPALVQDLIAETYDSTKKIAEAIKDANNLIQFYKDRLIEKDLKPSTLADTHLSDLDASAGKVNAHLLDLLSAKDAIKDRVEAVSNADLDIRSQMLTLKQRENTILDAKEKLRDYAVRAPFSGVIAKLDAKSGDSVNSGAVIATLIAKERIAEISLNEIDASGVAVGQKALLTFDALPDLKISGEVSEIDAIGAVSQGVVTYMVKIIFNAENNQIKPGMSVSADITIKEKEDVLLVPNAAIKFLGDNHFVEVPAASENLKTLGNFSGIVLSFTPERQPVTLGIVGDNMTEIVSGLSEGDFVIGRVINSQTASVGAPAQPSSAVKIPGFSGGGRSVSR